MSASEASADVATPPRWRRWGRLAALVVLALAVATSPWWGRAALSSLAFFRVRRVEIEGARYLSPSAVVQRLAVDTTGSVWQPLDPLRRRVTTHPLIASAHVRRKLPGTLVVRVTEKVPVALVASRRGFVAHDASGVELPIDPSRVPVDLPILAARDTGLLRFLGEVRDRVPALYARVSEVRRTARREVVVRLASVPVRMMADVRAERLMDILPVEQDLARSQARVVELDLRYREQVVARLE